MKMSNKYRLKDKKLPTITYILVCIRCGETKTKIQPAILPPANPSYTDRPSFIKCKLGNHHFYPKEELELNG